MTASQFSPHNRSRVHPRISLKDEMTKSIRFRLSIPQSYYLCHTPAHTFFRVAFRHASSPASLLHSGPSSRVSAMTQQRAREGLPEEQAGGAPPPSGGRGRATHAAPEHPHPPHCLLLDAKKTKLPPLGKSFSVVITSVKMPLMTS